MLAATGAAWLAETGTSGLTIPLPPGIQNNNGEAVTLAPMSNVQFTRPNGNAQILAGLALEKVTIASGYGTNVNFDVAWLDPQDTARVLGNPNVQIYFGFYYPIHTGACVGDGRSVESTLATITDNSTTFCAQLDTGAGGSPVVAGKLLLSGQQLTGNLRTTVSDATATAVCGGSGSTWCLPSVGAAASTEVAYLAATIVTPGGKPAGQQTDLSSLSFYFAASRH